MNKLQKRIGLGILKGLDDIDDNSILQNLKEDQVVTLPVQQIKPHPKNHLYFKDLDRKMKDKLIDQEVCDNSDEKQASMVTKDEEFKPLNSERRLVINIKNEEEPIKRSTYYLKVTTIKKIAQLAKSNGLYISDFVQKVFDEVLDLIEIKADGS